MNRCSWPANNNLMITYHDKEWGVPLHDDHRLFEFLVLDAFQAGLNWQTIINKREFFREAFDGFDVEKIARYDAAKVTELLQNAGIIRNKLKISAAITNAQAFIRIQQAHGSFDNFIWQFTGGKTIMNRWEQLKDIPVRSAESDAMSKALIQAGFKFVGSTICYAFMQAAGMVNDHLIDCFRYHECAGNQSS
ncbi:MAG: DNA-3-methyladenine glycosylase I [Bacteroidetes bacterium HGW-Bacteroidetes-1]|nr:MAG: DNA-3-methyladenine glycosylase I [Bacteroidetes bacterium HGW-Bacteroidetes-1]